MLQRCRGLFQDIPQRVLLQNQPRGKVQTPEDEVPAGAVPEAGAEPDDQNIPQRLDRAAPVSPQGDIQVLPEPTGQRHVPPPPELRNRCGQIGVVKVLVEPETKNPAQADGHIGVAGKVKVDLKAEGQQAHPAARRRQRPGSLGRQLGIPQSADGVRQQHFFSKAHTEPAGSQGKVLRAVDPVIQVLCHGLVLDDRPCDQLREHGDEGAEADDVPLHRGILPVDVDGVAHGLEGKEGNADWQWDIPQRDGDSQQGQAGGQSEPGQQKQVVRQEVPILEKAQKQQVEYHRLRHEPPGLFVVVPVLLHQ